MGGVWAGMSPTIKNQQLYTDFIVSQVKVISSTLYLVRGMPEPYDTEGEKLALALLRLFQDCPAMAITARKVKSLLNRSESSTFNANTIGTHTPSEASNHDEL